MIISDRSVIKQMYYAESNRLSVNNVEFGINKYSVEYKRNWYRALQRLKSVIHNIKNQMYLYWQAGDIAILDNRRLLHSRDAIYGQREVLIAYMDYDWIQLKLQQFD